MTVGNMDKSIEVCISSIVLPCSTYLFAENAVITRLRNVDVVAK